MDRGTRRHRCPRGERRAHSEDQFIQVRGPRGLPEPRAVLRGRPARPAGHCLAQGSIGANETPLITLLGLLRKKKKWRESGPPSEYFFPRRNTNCENLRSCQALLPWNPGLESDALPTPAGCVEDPGRSEACSGISRGHPVSHHCKQDEERSEDTRFCVFLWNAGYCLQLGYKFFQVCS